ncbi:hypothetical protein VNO77_30890 [Canavalia gladiata]|uniref:Neprosin PEP catalytic domain-containing protein n=1 Tax=Canavalia gladiata TaxID=3824 RepID=A0AAN9Q3G6_CANGL
MMNKFFFILCLVICSASHRIDGAQNRLKENLELEEQPKLIKKPPVKSIHVFHTLLFYYGMFPLVELSLITWFNNFVCILFWFLQTKFGYIVDCIDITKQPSFGHPLLQKHKLQRKPSFETTSVKNSSARSISGLEKYQCPIGTIPIRRTTKDDLIQAKSLLKYHPMMADVPGLHIAEVTLLPECGPYYDIDGTITVYNPTVENDQTSSAYIWVQTGENRILAGWHVSPGVYGDNATHLFVAWTSDNFQETGCINLQCPGFIQTSKDAPLGLRLEPTSTPGHINEITVAITKDSKANNWWFVLANMYIGYFPATLFSNLSSAKIGGWGGRTTTSKGTSSPPMGSGTFPDGIIYNACQFSSVSFQNSLRQNFGPKIPQTKTIVDRSNCYGAENYGDQGGPQVRYFLQFGGPGGNCGD